MRIAIAFCLVALTLPLAVQARDEISAGFKRSGVFKPNRGYATPDCINGVAKVASIRVEFSGEDDSLAKARDAFDAQKKAVETEAQKASGGKVALESYSYRISADNRYNNSVQKVIYQFSGSINYTVASEELAQKIADRFAEMKRPFTQNLSASTCSNP